MILYKYSYKAVFAVVLGMFFHANAIAQDAAVKTENPKDTVINKIEVLFGERSEDRFVGNQNTVSGEDLENYPTLDVREALAGKLPGLFMLQKNGNIGYDITTIDSDEDNFMTYIRGSYGDYIVLIDGFERPFANLSMEQIKDIKVLKDPVTKSMYGGRMSNGIIMITTKRGVVGKNQFKAKVQRGIKMPTRLPDYLNAAEFATQYNQALRNDNAGEIPDGLGYSDEAIAAYASQSNPLQYPDVDYYDEFLNNSMDITRVSTEYFGGTDQTQYYFQAGVQNEGGLEKYGSKQTTMNIYNLRANLDAEFNENITVLADFSGYLGDREYSKGFGAYKSNSTNNDDDRPIIAGFNTLSSRYPNAYPVFVAPDSLGGTSTFKDNPYGAQVRSGYIKETYAQMQANLGFVFKLDNLVEGLQVKPNFAFDIYHQQNLNSSNTVGIYEIGSFDEEGNPIAINEIQAEKLATSQTIGDDEYSKRWALNVLTSWKKEMGDHKVDADLLFLMSKELLARRLDDYRRQNVTLRSNYTFKGKYNIEGVLNYAGSSSYEKDNRFKLFPALGAGWVVSKEDFLKDNSLIDYLKLNATWGIMGDGNIAHRLWMDSWDASSGNYTLNKASLPLSGSQFAQIANNNLDWPTIREVDVNIEARLLKALGLKVSYFDYLTSGTLSKGGNTTPSILGGNVFLPQQNFGETSLKGTEAELYFRTKTKNWTFDIGTHMTMSKSEKIKIDEAYDPNYSRVGDATDDIRGYNAIGFYTQADIDNAITGDLAIPSGVSPSDLRVGNIKYEDVNGDKVIDKYDEKVIGNSTPRLMYGANMKIGYKNLQLYASFLGYGKYDRRLNGNLNDGSTLKYYHAYSTRKYSKAVIEGLPNGNDHPLLTTGTPTNDTKSSTYWIVNGSFLKLKNVSLSYTLPKNVSNSLKLGEVKLYVYGSNLFTASKIKDLDPESLSAGVTAFPLFSTYAGGLSISF
ncbi:SusC/RagA family TonB-linked outer membrane protein [Saccharicrinis sp. GN24d3]|uniref:SusC/RagA family TonB-linked outer membrane protein n=1 Tax=Saccharicrinis sp. GN24d3 TaxID=3458416 RepID=UPI00403714CD